MTATFSDRIIFRTMMNEIPCDTPNPCAVRKANCVIEVRAVSSCAEAFRCGFWCFIGRGSEVIWAFDKHTDVGSRLDGVWDQGKTSIHLSDATEHIQMLVAKNWILKPAVRLNCACDTIDALVATISTSRKFGRRPRNRRLGHPTDRRLPAFQGAVSCYFFFSSLTSSGARPFS